MIWKAAELELMVEESETLGGALEDIRAFCAVIEFGTVSGAARTLGETKGSISRRISRLERRLGAALLARTPRAVSATEEGLAFYAKAREALSLLADGAEGVRQSRLVPQGHLRVTAPIDLGVDVLPPLVVKFRALHPQITVELLLTDAALDLAAHRIDLALRATPGELPDMGYRASTVIGFHIGLYASPAYLAAHDLPTVPQALVEYDGVVRQAGVGAAKWVLTDRRSRAVEVAVRPVVWASDYASVHRIILAGGGIGPLPSMVAAASVAGGALVPVLPEWTLVKGKLYAISLSGLEAPARVRLFRAFIRSELMSTVAAHAL
ncbi:LysR family transcriptional regulator [Nitrosococcus oceani]|nr:LysR family transcriptional regulator [Nitrosococcus oceani]